MACASSNSRSELTATGGLGQGSAGDHRPGSAGRPGRGPGRRRQSRPRRRLGVPFPHLVPQAAASAVPLRAAGAVHGTGRRPPTGTGAARTRPPGLGRACGSPRCRRRCSIPIRRSPTPSGPVRGEARHHHQSPAPGVVGHGGIATRFGGQAAGRCAGVRLVQVPAPPFHSHSSSVPDVVVGGSRRTTESSGGPDPRPGGAGRARVARTRAAASASGWSTCRSCRSMTRPGSSAPSGSARIPPNSRTSPRSGSGAIAACPDPRWLLGTRARCHAGPGPGTRAARCGVRRRVRSPVVRPGRAAATAGAGREPRHHQEPPALGANPPTHARDYIVARPGVRRHGVVQSWSSA